MKTFRPPRGRNVFSAYCAEERGGASYFFSLLKHMNQSRQYWSSELFSMRSFAVPQLPAVGTMTSSPGLQSAGVATFSASAFCRAWMTLFISSKLRPVLRG